MYLKLFWTQLETVKLQGLCCLRPCSSRPYCTNNTYLTMRIFNKAVLSMTKICVICLFKKNFKAKCRLIQKILEASESCFPNREIWGERCKKTAFLKGSTNDGANQASYLLKRAPFLICKAKLYIQSTIDSQINIILLLLLSRLGHQDIT